jgi:L-asparaginase
MRERAAPRRLKSKGTGARHKILLGYNGGTIGELEARRGRRTILVPPANDREFREACEPLFEAFGGLVDLHYEFWVTADSTDLTPKDDWARLTQRIARAEEEEFLGVLIATGTNTLADTAAGVAFGLAGTNPKFRPPMVPTVFTGGQTSIHVAGGDGGTNPARALKTLVAAIEANIREVLVAFDTKVLLASRTMKISPTEFAGFDSPAYPAIGRINSTGVTLYPHLLDFKQGRRAGQGIAPNWAGDVLVVQFRPGLKPSRLERLLDDELDVLVLQPAGEGSLCAQGEYNLIPVIRRATDRGIPVILCSQFAGGSVGGGPDERSLTALADGGAIPAYDHTVAALNAKLQWAIGNGLCKSVDDYRRLMRTSFCGEVRVPRD